MTMNIELGKTIGIGKIMNIISAARIAAKQIMSLIRLFVLSMSLSSIMVIQAQAEGMVAGTVADTVVEKASEALVIEQGFVRKPLPGRSMSAAFMKIRNTSTQDIIITQAHLKGAASVEIHSHSHIEGVMRMRQVCELPIKAGEVVSLQPGGLHLMVFGITQLAKKPKLDLCTRDNICYSSHIEIRSLIKK